jgi:hypothetical protein
LPWSCLVQLSDGRENMIRAVMILKASLVIMFAAPY